MESTRGPPTAAAGCWLVGHVELEVDQAQQSVSHADVDALDSDTDVAHQPRPSHGGTPSEKPGTATRRRAGGRSRCAQGV